MKIFFENYSILQLIFLLRIIRKADNIFFLHLDIIWERATNNSMIFDRARRLFRFQSFPELKKRLVVKVIKMVAPRTNVKEFDYEKFATIYYGLNKTCLEDVDQISNEIKASAPYEILNDIMKDDALIKYYKAYMARVIPRWHLFLHLAKDLVSSNSNILIIPDNTYPEYFRRSPYHELAKCVPSSVFFLNHLRFHFKVITAYAKLTMIPAIMFLLHSKNLIKKFGDVSYYDVAIPVLWGIFKDSEEKMVQGVKRSNDDLYLYGNDFLKGQIIHIIGEWKYSREMEKKFKLAMNEKEIPYIRKSDYKLDKKIIIGLILIQFRILKHLYLVLRCSRIHFCLINATTKGLFQYINKFIEIQNVNYKVEFIKSDYNPAHVISTILCNQNGRKTIGIAHAASPYDAPQLAYAHFNKYLVLSEIYVRTFGKYWDNSSIVRTGRESLDLIWDSIQKKDSIREKINKLYGERKYIVMVTLPGLGPIILNSRYEAFYKGLLLVKQLEIDCHIFLRIRNIQLLERDSVLKKIYTLSSDDNRIILDHENFTTLDLISASDLLISAAASWAINEGLIAGSKVFTFGFTNKEDLYFSDYGADFILKTPEDIENAFKGLENGYENIDCDWEKLKQDADYFQDGKNSLRIQKTIIDEIAKMAP